MLMRMRCHEKCASALALTWNLLVSSLGLSSEMNSLFCHGYLLTRTIKRKPKWHVDVSIGWAMRAPGR
jgi:hypothetical protein